MKLSKYSHDTPYTIIVPRLSNGRKESETFPLLLIIVSYPRAETSQRAKPRRTQKRGGRGGESRPELCDVYHRDRTVENRYLDRGKKSAAATRVARNSTRYLSPGVAYLRFVSVIVVPRIGLLWPDAGQILSAGSFRSKFELSFLE